VVSDWDALEKVWTNSFKELLVTPAEEYGGVLLCDAITNSKDGRERMTNILFEKFQLPNAYISAQPMLSMYGAGRTTGITIDVGEDFIHCVPIVEGYPVLYNAQKIPAGGKAITEAVQKALAGMGTTVDEFTAREVKHANCYVAMDFDAEVAKLGNAAKKEYVLPDGARVQLGVEQVQCAELMFQPEQAGINYRGMQHAIYKVVMGSDYDQRDELWKNLLLVGGGSLMRNLPERLERELAPLAPSDKRVKLTSQVERPQCAWIGGSILASLTTFGQMWITKEEYDESGPSIVHRKCI